ncbi:MAG: NADH:flavin oxidoreductase [Nitrososphaeria archaeon]
MVGLLDPLKVKKYTFCNRVVMPPMLTNLAATDGSVTDKLVDHYVRRCNMLGLLIIEAAYVSVGGSASEKQLGIYSDLLIPGLKRLAQAVHDKGTPVVVQIAHSGSKAYTGSVGLQPVAPSATDSARELTLNEIEGLLGEFAEAARRALAAGFDGVEVHGAHGVLVNQFFSPLTNKRRDRYGGSLENRMRFPLEVVERIKEEVGNGILLYRIGAEDLTPGGTKIEDSIKLAKRLEELGVDVIDVSGGLCGSRPPQLQNIPGYFVPQAKKIKNKVSMPVIGVGNIKDPRYANSLIEEEAVDLVAIGRQLMNDPDWVLKAVKALENI